jgi:hypothetical protein
MKINTNWKEWGGKLKRINGDASTNRKGVQIKASR